MERLPHSQTIFTNMCFVWSPKYVITQDIPPVRSFSYRSSSSLFAWPRMTIDPDSSDDQHVWSNLWVCHIRARNRHFGIYDQDGTTAFPLRYEYERNTFNASRSHDNLRLKSLIGWPSSDWPIRWPKHSLGNTLGRMMHVIGWHWVATEKLIIWGRKI